MESKEANDEITKRRRAVSSMPFMYIVGGAMSNRTLQTVQYLLRRHVGSMGTNVWSRWNHKARLCVGVSKNNGKKKSGKEEKGEIEIRHRVNKESENGMTGAFEHVVA